MGAPTNETVTESAAKRGDKEVAMLRQYVAELVAAQGTRLPPEPELSNLLGLPRNRLRYALRKLETEGLIWRHVGKGTFIGQRSLATEGLEGLVNPQDVMEARLVVEPRVANLAALRATTPDLIAMRQCLAALQENRTSYWEWRIWDERLHRLIATAARNPMLLGVIDLIRGSTEIGLRHRMEQIYTGKPLDDTNVEHEKIVRAIGDRDPAGAEALMREHLYSVKERLFGER